MISIYQLKPAFQNLLRPIVVVLANRRVTPNQITLFTTFLSIGLGVLLRFRAVHLQAIPDSRYGFFLIVPIFLFFRMALNAIDGMLAREHKMQTKLGAILNELTDVISDAAIYLPFCFVKGVLPELVIGVTLMSGLSEMAGVLAQTVGSQRRYDGPMGKSDRAFVFGSIGLALGLGTPPETWLNWTFLGISGLLALSTWNRIKNACFTSGP